MPQWAQSSWGCRRISRFASCHREFRIAAYRVRDYSEKTHSYSKLGSWRKGDPQAGYSVPTEFPWWTLKVFQYGEHWGAMGCSIASGTSILDGLSYKWECSRFGRILEFAFFVRNLYFRAPYTTHSLGILRLQTISSKSQCTNSHTSHDPRSPKLPLRDTFADSIRWTLILGFCWFLKRSVDLWAGRRSWSSGSLSTWYCWQWGLYFLTTPHQF